MNVAMRWGVIFFVLMLIPWGVLANEYYPENVVEMASELGYLEYFDNGQTTGPIAIDSEVGLEEYLTGDPDLASGGVVRIPGGASYVILGFTTKTIKNEPGVDFIIRWAGSSSQPRVFVFFQYANEDEMKINWGRPDTTMRPIDVSGSFSENSRTIPIDLDTIMYGEGLDWENRRVVAVKIEGPEDSTEHFDLQYVEISQGSRADETAWDLFGTVDVNIINASSSSAEIPQRVDVVFMDTVFNLSYPLSIVNSDWGEVGLPAGSYNYTVDADGFVEVGNESNENVVIVPFFNGRVPLDLQLKKNRGQISGDVTVDYPPNILPNELTVRLTNTETDVSQTASTQVNDGYYEFNDIEFGYEYTLEILVDGYTEDSRIKPIYVEADTTEDFELVPLESTRIIKGYIKYATLNSQTPLSRTTVKLIDISEESKSSKEYFHTTGEDGQFEITNVNLGKYKVDINGEYFTFSSYDEIFVSPTTPSFLEYTLPIGVIKGKVVDGSSQKELEGAEVILTNTETGESIGPDLTDETGEFHFLIEFGTYTITASLNDDTSSSIERTVSQSSPVISLQNPIALNNNIEPGTLSVVGKVYNSIGNEPIPDATVKIFLNGQENEDPVASETTPQDGSFSFSGLESRIYSVVVFAENFHTYGPSDFFLQQTSSTQVYNVPLDPRAPIIERFQVDPERIEAGSDQEVTFFIQVSDPDGVDDISEVILSHPSLAQVISDGGITIPKFSSIQLNETTLQYEYTTGIFGKLDNQNALKPKDYLLNLVVRDTDFETKESLTFSVYETEQATIDPEEVLSRFLQNTLDNQTLVFSIKVGTDLFSRISNGIGNGENSIHDGDDNGIKDNFRSLSRSSQTDCPDCYVEVRIYRPDSTLYNTYIVCESKDIVIPNAEAGQWTYETTNYCSQSLDVQIETRGEDTAVLTGTVKDSHTGLVVQNAKVEWNLGGEGYSAENGYFSVVVVAGEGILSTTLTDYQVNFRGNISLKSGITKQVNISLVPEESAYVSLPKDQVVSEILEPLPLPDPYVQPFTSSVNENDELYIDALFPPYEDDVTLYLAVGIVYENVPYLFFFDQSDLLVLYGSGAFTPWRNGCCGWGQFSNALNIPIDALPVGRYTFYSLATDDPLTFSAFDFKYFTIDIPPAD